MLINKRWCRTLSKAFEKGRTIKSCLPLSMEFASSWAKVTSCVSQLHLAWNPCWQAVNMVNMLWLSDDFRCCWFKHVLAIYIWSMLMTPVYIDGFKTVYLLIKGCYICIFPHHRLYLFWYIAAMNGATLYVVWHLAVVRWVVLLFSWGGGEE